LKRREHHTSTDSVSFEFEPDEIVEALLATSAYKPPDGYNWTRTVRQKDHNEPDGHGNIVVSYHRSMTN
jgi:hypothetical protein